MHTSVTKRKRRPGLIACLLLFIPLGIASVCYYPQYYQFIAMGEIVSVQEVGVKGSVHFCYVYEGVTKNWYERWSAERSYPDAHFEPADASAQDDYSEMIEVGEQVRDETIRQAVIAADDQTDDSEPTDQFEQRLEALIEETANYYGDSLGLMIGIGLVEEAEHADYSVGGKYNIAGTGTMEEGQVVGSVGAIRYKLLTAEEAGVDYFLVPQDKDRYYYDGLSNEEEAAMVSKELDLKLKVVPVANLEEALTFLRQLAG